MADKWAQYAEPAQDKWAKYAVHDSEANKALAGTGLSVSPAKAAPVPSELGPDQNISPWRDPTQGLIGQGVRQIGRGVAGLTREGVDPKMEAASDIVGGLGKVATPVAIGAALPALAAAPATTAAGIVGGGVLGAGLGAGGEAAAEALGAGPGGKALARQTGEVAGGVLGYKAGSGIAPAIGRIAGRIKANPDPLIRMLPKGREIVAAKDYLMGKPAPPTGEEIPEMWDQLAGGKGAYAKLGDGTGTPTPAQLQVQSIANRLDKGVQQEAPRGPQAPRGASHYGMERTAPPPAPVVGSDYVMPPPADVAPPAFSQPEGFTSPGSQMPTMPEAHPTPPLVRGPGGRMENPLQAIGAAEQLKQSLGMPPEPNAAIRETKPPVAGTMPPMPEKAPAISETPPPTAPNFEAAYTPPESSTPNYTAPKEHYQAAARTVKGRAIARLLRDSNVSAEKAGTWKLGGPELQKAAASAGVNAPTTPEALAVMLDELRKMPARGTVEFARGGIVAPKKKSRGRFSRRGVWYGNPKDMPPAPRAAPPGMPPEPEMS